ncbi:ABC transporter permease subunit, partial [Bullifex sp.]|uniref:ABC transporter permease n=1 Tax=Bullifex sp. TaxID=2815808 RepID=UPI002A7EFB5B
VVLIRAGVNPYVAVLAATGVGAIAGLVTAALHTKCGIPAILAGILTQLALYSVNLRIMGGKSNQPVSVDKYNLLVSQRFVRDLSFDNPVILLVILLAVLIAVIYWFFGTEKGCSMRATGANKDMARAQGINPDNDIILGLMVSNALVALSGALVAQYQGAVDVNMGRGAIVIGLASVIIGEVVFKKIKHNFAGTLTFVVLGSIIYYIVIQITLQLGLNTNDLKLITAVIVALFLAVPYWKTKFFSHRKGVKNA